MKKTPAITYNIPFRFLPDELRPGFFRELAVNGAKHIVLGMAILPQLMSRPELPEMIAKELADAGLTFMDSHAPCGLHWDLSAPFEDERALRLLRLKLAIELAAFFKVGTMTLHLGKKQPGVSPEERLEKICRCLDELLPFAAEKKVILCLENSYAYFGMPQIILDIKERYPADTLGFCFDAGHANMTTSPDPEKQQQSAGCSEILEAMLPHIVNCHIHDNGGTFDSHTLPGRGTGDWTFVRQMLEKAPRLQVIQSEVNLAGSVTAVREVIETFEKLFGSSRS